MAKLERRSPPVDIPTLMAMGLVAHLIVNLVHEAVGHGGVCLAVGGRPLALSSAWWDASYEGVSAWSRRAVRAGGTLANLSLGAACVVAFQRRVHWPSAHTRYFVWLLAVMNLFSGAGYLMVDPIGNFGDWSGFVNGLEHPLAWRVGLCATGLVLTRLAQAWGLRELERLLGQDPARPSSGLVLARHLCWWPYAVGGVAFTLAGLLNPQGPVFAFTSALATFGAQVMLACLPAWVSRSDRPFAPPIVLGRSPGWLLAGGVAAAVLFGALARSIPLRGSP